MFTSWPFLLGRDKPRPEVFVFTPLFWLSGSLELSRFDYNLFDIFTSSSGRSYFIKNLYKSFSIANGFTFAIYEISCELSPKPNFFSTLKFSVFQFSIFFDTVFVAIFSLIIILTSTSNKPKLVRHFYYPSAKNHQPCHFAVRDGRLE